MTLLMRAALLGDTSDIRKALRKEQVNRKTPQGATVLMIAAQVGNAGLIRLLVDAGADVNAQDDAGMTALMRAAESAQANCIKELLHAGAHADLRTGNGTTALMLAVSNPEALRILLEA
jgi:ankyrin repeat protein